MSPQIKLRNILMHLPFWIGYFLLQFFFLSETLSNPESILLASRIVTLHIFLYYVNTYILLPRFIQEGKYLSYVIAVAVVAMGVYFIVYLSNDIPIIREAMNNDRKMRHGQNSPPLTGFFTRYMMNNILSTFGILFLSMTSWIITRDKERRQTELSVMNETLATEMKFLKTQINPHFLFNALNNIYSLSYSDSGKTSEMIMKLSEMLRYVLYESSEKKVLLSQEVEYIKNFIKFQLIKYEHGANISLDETAANGSLMIEPMLLIPFVENAFKHGNIQQNAGFITIDIKTEGTKLLFSICNSFSSGHAKDRTSGIGLTNVQKRLHLLYPGKHEIIVVKENETFNVSLIIDTL